MNTEKSQNDLKVEELLKLSKENHTEDLKMEQHKTTVHPRYSVNCGEGVYLVIFVLGNVDEIDPNQNIFFTLPVEGCDQEDLNENLKKLDSSFFDRCIMLKTFKDAVSHLSKRYQKYV